MPVSKTTPGRLGACEWRAQTFCLPLNAQRRHPGQSPIAAQWLAYAYPCQRFAPHLAVRHA